MKVTYELNLKENITIDNYNKEKYLWPIEGSEVIFLIDEQSKKIIDLKIVFSGLPIKYTENNLIDPYYPETKFVAYKIATYISNYLLFNSSTEVFDSKDLLIKDIEAEPETKEELSIWGSSRKQIYSDLKVTYSILGSVNINEVAQKYTDATAYSHYADGLRNNNIISSFEQYYKIIETYFNLSGTSLDRAVSQYATNFDPKFTPQYVENLRIIRNRCTHAQHNHGHITTDDLDLLNLVVVKIEELKNLCRCLIENPIN